MRQAGRLSCGQGLPQVGGVSGEQVDALVQIPVDGLDADAVAGGEPPDPGAVKKLSQDEHRLGEAAEGPAPFAGAAPAPFCVQQPGHEQYRLPL